MVPAQESVASKGNREVRLGRVGEGELMAYSTLSLTPVVSGKDGLLKTLLYVRVNERRNVARSESEQNAWKCFRAGFLPCSP